MKKEILVGALVGLGAIVGVTTISNGINSQMEAERLTQAGRSLAKEADAGEIEKAKVEPVVEVKQGQKTEAIAFETTYYNDTSLAKGSTRVDREGVNGVKTITYSVTYTDGVETSREAISEEITTAPIAKVVANGTYVAPPTQTQTQPQGTTQNCPNGTYVNSAGQTVCRPSSTNAGGATAICRDGTYSYSQSRRGTCSHHGGVKQWL